MVLRLPGGRELVVAHPLLLQQKDAEESAWVGCGAWARVTIDRFRHSSLSTFKKHRASTNTFFNQM